MHNKVVSDWLILGTRESLCISIGILFFKKINKRIKYLGINLTKDVKDLYPENGKILKKK